MDYLVFDSDDFGVDHVISDMCQSHDCRDVLMELKKINPNFKATLFTIPMEITLEMMNWAENNRDWIELAYHGFSHHSNYECEKMPEEDFDLLFNMCTSLMPGIKQLFVKGFKAPGWQISDGAYAWLKKKGFWVADQDNNDERRPKELKVYKVGENSVHTHTWNCVGNGVYELFDELKQKVADNKEWRFVSESLSNNT